MPITDRSYLFFVCFCVNPSKTMLQKSLVFVDWLSDLLLVLRTGTTSTEDRQTRDTISRDKHTRHNNHNCKKGKQQQTKIGHLAIRLSKDKDVLIDRSLSLSQKLTTANERTQKSIRKTIKQQ